jgi:hypothetical protein
MKTNNAYTTNYGNRNGKSNFATNNDNYNYNDNCDSNENDFRSTIRRMDLIFA